LFAFHEFVQDSDMVKFECKSSNESI